MAFHLPLRFPDHVHRYSVFSFAVLLAACSPLQPDPVVSTETAAPLSVKAEAQPTPPTGDDSPVVAERPSVPTAQPARLVRTRLAGIEMEAVVFDSRRDHLVIRDQPEGPGSLYADSRAAGRGSLAAINASFFTPEGGPLGLVVSSGKSVGSVNHASSLGSGFFQEKSGTLSLIRRGRFTSADEAIQAGPFLVENGRPTRGLSSDVATARSFVATDGRNGWIIARSGACSLAQLSEALGGSQIGGVTIQAALNLDGGRSSELWVSDAVEGGPSYTRPFWNKPVRNFLLLQAR